MTNFKYFPNVPNPPDDPADDVAQMQTNTLSTQNLIGVDHITFLAPNGGYHNIIHMVPNTTPSNINNIGQLWSQQVIFNGVTDEALYFRGGGTSTDRIVQITAPTGYKANSNGYSFLPGGMILQWGVASTASAPAVTTITFLSSGNINFPTNIFTAYAMPGGTANTGSAITVTNLATTGFKINTSSAISSSTTLYWFAIGN